MDPQLSFFNIADQFFLTLMVINLVDIVFGEWRPVTEHGKQYFNFLFLFVYIFRKKSDFKGFGKMWESFSNPIIDHARILVHVCEKWRY